MRGAATVDTAEQRRLDARVVEVGEGIKGIIMRLKKKAATIAAIGISMVGTLATGAGSASASVSCGTNATTGGWQCDGYALGDNGTIWLPNSYSGYGLWAGTRVTVTCYYTYDAYQGAPADGYWDHTTWNSEYGSLTGHIDDVYVDFGGKTPPQLGIPRC